jgi:ribosomal-protein-alanine N-acetyltransferase
MALALRTPRLLLREWRDDDLESFLAMSVHLAQTEYLPPGDPDWVARVRAHWGEHGFGPFAVELPGEAAFIGVVGLDRVRWQLRFTPAVQVGWRLARPYWGRGYAREAARAVLDDGFYRLHLDRIVAYTVPANRRSWAVMERLGMNRDPADDFDHPHYPPGHKLSRHVLYRLDRPAR